MAGNNERSFWDIFQRGPMTMTVTPKARGPEWVRFTNYGVIQSLYGMPPEQARQDGACGSATVGGLRISPEALANLHPQQIIERHDLIGMTIAVSNVGQGAVTLTETGPMHRIDSAYDASTGTLSAVTLTQQIGLATITHSIRLTGQQ